jgi:hypothetical protein
MRIKRLIHEEREGREEKNNTKKFLFLGFQSFPIACSLLACSLSARSLLFSHPVHPVKVIYNLL